MSQPTAASIIATLSEFDSFVRVALSEGDIDRVKGKEDEIVSQNILYISKAIKELHLNLFRKSFTRLVKNWKARTNKPRSIINSSCILSYSNTRRKKMFLLFSKINARNSKNSTQRRWQLPWRYRTIQLFLRYLKPRLPLHQPRPLFQPFQSRPPSLLQNQLCQPTHTKPRPLV
jgi:hypothetical protein